MDGDGANTTYVTYRMLRGSQPLELEVAPLVTYHDFHSLTRGGWRINISDIADGIEVRAFDGATPLCILAPGAQFAATNEWYWKFRHREETARGLDDRSDVLLPGRFTQRVCTDDSLTLVLTTELNAKVDARQALESERSRERQLLEGANAARDNAVMQQLTVATDQFVVRRDVDQGEGRTVIAGYHWFNDWGRDSMISLPGLTLSTGRTEDAAVILRTFARYVDLGMLPHNFPDNAGALPGYKHGRRDTLVYRRNRAVRRGHWRHALVDGPVAASVVDHVGGALLAGIGLAR